MFIVLYVLITNSYVVFTMLWENTYKHHLRAESGLRIRLLMVHQKAGSSEQTHPLLFQAVTMRLYTDIIIVTSIMTASLHSSYNRRCALIFSDAAILC